MSDTKTFDELFENHRDTLGRALQTKMEVENLGFRGLATELDMPYAVLNHIALGTKGTMRCVPNYLRHVRVAHWLGLLEPSEDKPATLSDVFSVIARLDVSGRTKRMIHDVMVAILREDAT